MTCFLLIFGMPLTLDALSQDALVLPPDQRVTLAYRLLISVDSEPEPGASAAWEAEISQRIARFDAGETQTVPASQVFSRLREIASGQ
jgi:putative addiction module component (TIGR02574 family)